MSLEQWASFWRVAQGRRLAALADMVSVVHAKNPAKARQRIVQARKEVMSGKPRMDARAFGESMRQKGRRMGVAVKGGDDG